MKFKKLTAIFTALACVGVLASSFGMTTSATDSEPCDVDGDGYVNILDAITVNRYLIGDGYVQYYNQLDANRNLIVDSADVDCIMSKIANQNYSAEFVYRENDGPNPNEFPAVSGFTPDDDANSTAFRRYVKYVYGSMPSTYTGDNLINFLIPYTLTPSTTLLTQQNQNSPRGQVGDEDDRELSIANLENTGIVNINGECTGFIVADHVIATAAHCVYQGYDASKGQKERFPDLTIRRYSISGELTGKPLTPVEVHILRAYRNGGDAPERDYALVTVEEPLSNYVHFNLGTSYNVPSCDGTDNTFDHVPIYVTGGSNSLGIDEGRVYKEGNNGSVLTYDVDTAGGQSGSPVYTITKQIRGNSASYVYTALAIHNRAGDRDYDNLLDSDDHPIYLWNEGTRITKYLTQFYLNNPNISY